MFNAEKLLGGLIRGKTRGGLGGLGGLISSGAALGALGVAMEAVEHFMKKPSGSGTPSPRTGAMPPPMPGSVPPPPPAMTGGPAAPLPVTTPPPSSEPASAAPASAAAESPGDSEAVLLIRAMIAAANADGIVDQAERNSILEHLQTIDLSPEEHSFIVQELLSPADLEAIVGSVNSPAMAEQVYTVSLMAIDVDTESECRYMATLADRLGLDPSTVENIHRCLEPA